VKQRRSKTIHLKDVNIFKGFAQEQLDQYLALFHNRSFMAGERIHFNHLQEDAIFIVKKGRVKISYFSEDGSEFIVTILRPGDVFSRHSEAILTPMERTDIWLILTKDFKKILADHPLVSMMLIQELGKIMRLMNDVIQDLAFREVSGRIAHLLLRETADTGSSHTNGPEAAELNLTHENLASMVGSSRQTVTGILNRMVQRKIVSQRRGKITIINREALKNYAD